MTSHLHLPHAHVCPCFAKNSLMAVHCCDVELFLGQLEQGFKEGLNNAIDRYGQNGQEEITNAFDELQQKVRYAIMYLHIWHREFSM